MRILSDCNSATTGRLMVVNYAGAAGGVTVRAVTRNEAVDEYAESLDDIVAVRRPFRFRSHLRSLAYQHSYSHPPNCSDRPCH
jgi:hypothetical protein